MKCRNKRPQRAGDLVVFLELRFMTHGALLQDPETDISRRKLDLIAICVRSGKSEVFHLSPSCLEQCYN